MFSFIWRKWSQIKLNYAFLELSKLWRSFLSVLAFMQVTIYGSFLLGLLRNEVMLVTFQLCEGRLIGCFNGWVSIALFRFEDLRVVQNGLRNILLRAFQTWIFPFLRICCCDEWKSFLTCEVRTSLFRNRLILWWNVYGVDPFLQLRPFTIAPISV